MVKRLRIGKKEYELEKDMSCEEVKGLSEFLYIDNLKEEIEQLKQENEQLRNENERLKSQQKWTEETLQKKLIVEIKPDLYGWRANVKELENE